MFKHFYYLAAAAMITFAACSSDEELTDSSDITSDADNTYMGVTLYMSGEADTRSSSSSSSSSYASGTEAEYAVDWDNSIFLFYDSSGKYLTSGTITSTPEGSTETVSSSTDGEEYSYDAVVILGSTTTQPTQVVAILNDANCSSYTSCSTLSALQEKLFSSSNETTVSYTSGESTATATGLLMSNAVKYDGSSFAFATSCSDYLKTSKSEAESIPVTIYVERAKAKVAIGVTSSWTAESDGSYKYTLKKSTDSSTDSTFTYYYVDETDGLKYVTDATVSITINGWAVNATNTTGYVIKNYTTSSGLASEITSDSKGGAWGSSWYSSYRIFWAVDANYDGTSSTSYTTNLSYSSWSDVTGQTTPCSTDAAYYYEQTLDPNATTGYEAGATALAPTLLVAATVSASSSTATSEATDNSDDANDLFLWQGAILYSKQAVYAKILSALKELDTSISDGTTISSITWETVDASKGTVKISAITLSDNSTVSDDNISSLNSNELINYTAATTDASASSVLRRYNAGACYYQVPIETYITSSSSPYGLVRNTWYDITISSITGIGGGVNSTSEDLEYIPGEDTNYYLGANVNILAWRKSSQTVDL